MTLSTSTASCPDLLATGIDLPCATCDSGRFLSARGFCCRDFRNTLGSFATGVTIVTALAPDGLPIGLTINSFNSVSLEPPLILWSLSLGSPMLEAFRRTSHYAVNILSADQQHLSDRFAVRGIDHFADLPQRAGLGGAPLIDGCCAWFECANQTHYPGGDHLIFVGLVERFAEGAGESPLVFHGARYCRIDQSRTTE